MNGRICWGRSSGSSTEFLDYRPGSESWKQCRSALTSLLEFTAVSVRQVEVPPPHCSEMRRSRTAMLGRFSECRSLSRTILFFRAPCR